MPREPSFYSITTSGLNLCDKTSSQQPAGPDENLVQNTIDGPLAEHNLASLGQSKAQPPTYKPQFDKEDSSDEQNPPNGEDPPNEDSRDDPDIAKMQPGQLFSANQYLFACRTRHISLRSLSHINIGIENRIFLYEKDVTLKYYVDTKSLERMARAVGWDFVLFGSKKASIGEYVARCMYDGFQSWESQVSVMMVFDRREAHFTVAAAPPLDTTEDDSEDNTTEGLLASAFFPNFSAHERVVTIYPLSFQKEHRDHLTGILAHESGHILGIRHEFAQEKEKYWACMLYGNRDQSSVMCYKHPRDLKVSRDDKQNLRKLYEAVYSGTKKFGGFKVQLVNPNKPGY
ncbi:hypothetical protein TWF730_009010 [Orbilia blumenaviensis]